MSFVITRFPVPLSTFTVIQQELVLLDSKQHRFFLHVLVSNLLNLNKIHNHGLAGWIDIGVELPCEWIEEHFSSKFKVRQIPPALLTFEEYSTSKHQCRSFTASEKLRQLLLSWSPACLERATEEPIVNLFDGKPYQVHAPQEWDNGIYSPKIIRKAVAAIQSCSFNYEALDGHLQYLFARIQMARTEPERMHLELSYRNDKSCADRIRAGCSRASGNIATYRPEYRTIYTGRIAEIGGGTQSCSRAMKAAMFDGVPDLKNYDLKRAQAFILLQELEDAEQPRDWVEQYVHATNANEERASALGISKDVYKTCLYATIMGAPHARHWNRSENKIYNCLIEECHGNEAQAKERAIKVYGALGPLKAEVKAWHDYLLGSDSCAHVDPTYKKVRALKNACGQHFKLENAQADKLARKAAAFILQGQEAAFIHRLTVLGPPHGFVPMSNQHDGLVVIGDIPTAAIKDAASQSGLRYASMEVKAFQ